jgi:hypothetical protein
VVVLQFRLLPGRAEKPLGDVLQVLQLLRCQIVDAQQVVVALP